MLLEDDLDVGSALDLASEEREGAETKAAQGGMEVRSAHDPGLRLAARLSSRPSTPPLVAQKTWPPESELTLWAPVGDPVGLALSTRLDGSAAAFTRAPGVPVDRTVPETGVEGAAHQGRGLVEEASQLLFAELPERAPRRDLSPP
jgi:hypothetical protein